MQNEPVDVPRSKRMNSNSTEFESQRYYLISEKWAKQHRGALYQQFDIAFKPEYIEEYGRLTLDDAVRMYYIRKLLGVDGADETSLLYQVFTDRTGRPIRLVYVGKPEELPL